MKYCTQTFVWLAVTLFPYKCHAQLHNENCPQIRISYDRLYYFTVSYNFEIAIPDELTPFTVRNIHAFKKFKIIQSLEKSYIIIFIDTLENFSFFIDKIIFNCNAVPVTARYFALSVTTLPIKVRAFPQNYFDWEVNKNLGAGIGYYGSWNRTGNISVGILFNAAASAIVLDSFSTNGYTDKFISTDVLTVGIGLCFIFSRNFQISLMGGSDFISDRYSEYNWVYNKQPWFGFGIGYSIISFLEQEI